MYKTYKKIATVKAKLFVKGDQDGMTCSRSLCIFVDENGDYKQCHKCTAGDIPYIITKENQKFTGEFGKNYICIGIDQEKWLIDKDIFEKTYVESLK